MFNEAQSNLFNFNFSNRLDWLTGELSENGKCFENRVGGMDDLSVAPFAGAWIETFSAHFNTAGSIVSHPSRVRGLKRD